MGTARGAGPPSRSEAGEDDARFQVSATGIVASLFVMMKVALLHDMSNRAVRPAMRRFQMALEAFERQCVPDAALQFVGDAVYVNQRLVRADVDTWEKACFLKDFFAKLQIAEVAFHGPPDDEALRDFVQAAREASLDAGLAESFRGRTFGTITVRDLRATGTALADVTVVLPDKVRVLRAFGVMLVCLREVVAKVRAGEPASLAPVRRAVQDFVRLPPGTSGLQAGLLGMGQFREELAGRLANVSVITVLMGRRLGLGVPELREIGVTAALAGIGRALDPALDVGTIEECAARGATVDGARRLLGASGRGRAAALRIIVGAELSAAEPRRTGHPLTRLIAVAEAYGALTDHPPRGRGLQPVAALRELTTSDAYDRAAARLLLCTLGMFPVGSTVRLSTGETALVTAMPASSDRMERPVVTVISDRSGAPSRPRVVDLSTSSVTIVGTVDAEEIDLNVGHYLFA